MLANTRRYIIVVRDKSGPGSGCSCINISRCGIGDLIVVSHQLRATDLQTGHVHGSEKVHASELDGSGHGCSAAAPRAV